jgi:hypothetical protein
MQIVVREDTRNEAKPDERRNNSLTCGSAYQSLWIPVQALRLCVRVHVESQCRFDVRMP